MPVAGRQKSKRLSGHISTSAELELCGGHIFTNIQYYLTYAHYAHTVHSTYAWIIVHLVRAEADGSST